jgi:hypothetical protein
MKPSKTSRNHFFLSKPSTQKYQNPSIAPSNRTTELHSMCKQTQITYLNCSHRDTYTDRTFNHSRKGKAVYYKNDVSKCPKLREEAYTVNGQCTTCFAEALAEERERKDEQAQEYDKKHKCCRLALTEE